MWFLGMAILNLLWLAAVVTVVVFTLRILGVL